MGHNNTHITYIIQSVWNVSERSVVYHVSAQVNIKYLACLRKGVMCILFSVKVFMTCFGISHNVSLYLLFQQRYLKYLACLRKKVLYLLLVQQRYISSV